MKKIIIYTDGGCRGNPGPSAVGAVFCNEKGEVIKKYSEILEGEATNNEAEYQAVIFAIKKLKAVFGKKLAFQSEIEIRADSELLVKQLNGRYKILEPRIQSLFLTIWNLKLDFQKIRFKLIPRNQNKLADGLANEALDNQDKTQKLII
jgi:ribonuclease HI